MLYGNNTYCCLGVACDISQIGEWAVFVGEWAVFNRYQVSDLDKSETTMPDAVRRFYGFTTGAGDYIDKRGVSQSLMNDNDAGHTFDQIADIIEAEPLGLFDA